MIRPSIRAIFPAFSMRFEGRVNWMYLDVKGLVTTGIGCLLKTPEQALALPWRKRSTGALATHTEIVEEWNRIKAATWLAEAGFRAAGDNVARLYLRDEAVDALMIERLDKSEAWLRRIFPNWDTFPADAQLGILSMAWAMGADFPTDWPKFTAAARAGNWWICADECKMREEGNAGIVPRNLADRALFLCAAVADSPTAYPGYAEDVHWRAAA